jgi:hypothetical protein
MRSIVTLQVKPGTTWDEVYARARAAAPEAFDADRILNLHGGDWQRSGVPGEHVTPVDGTPIQGPPRVTHDEAAAAVQHAHREHDAWTGVDLDERKTRVSAAVEGLAEVRDTLALLLAWEIGKPWKLACADVDRALDGVRWYLGEIDRQLQGRSPLPGPVSNIASWNYPMSVQVHAELVQCLAGNGVVAKTPSQGGFHTLTLAHAVMVRAGLPVTLLSGVGSQLGDVLIRSEEIGCLAFVGGRANGRKAATSLADTGKRHFLEQEASTPGASGTSRSGTSWRPTSPRASSTPSSAAPPTRATSCSARWCRTSSRCTCRSSRGLRFGHPLAVEAPDDELPDLHFGPLISASQGRDLRRSTTRPVSGGGIPLYRGSLERALPRRPGHLAYARRPRCSSRRRRGRCATPSPFGPLDSIVVVDSEAELLAP